MATANYQIQTYIVSAGANPLGPYLIPPSFPQPLPQPLQPLTMYIYNVCGKDAASGSCAIQTDQQNVDFSLKIANDPFNVLCAQVTVQTANVFSDNLANRQTLMQSFAAFCYNLQKMELAPSPQCLIPGGAAIIANQVAGTLPLRLDEILFYYYGMTPNWITSGWSNSSWIVPNANCIDLQPGMRLRIDTGAYQFISSSSSLNAFTAQGQIHCGVARNSSQQLYFDPYLNGLSVSITQTSPPQIGSLLDLAALGSRRYFRLIYPTPMNNPTRIYSAPGLGQNVALFGADTLDDLANATRTYLSTKSCASASSGNQPIICAYFTGRTIVVPEVPIRFLGQLIYVPVGTTLQNLLDLYNVLPPDQTPQNWKFWRNAATPLVVSGQYGQQVFSFLPTQYVPVPNSTRSTSQWDLPLVKGDSLAWPLN